MRGIGWPARVDVCSELYTTGGVWVGVSPSSSEDLVDERRWYGSQSRNSPDNHSFWC